MPTQEAVHKLVAARLAADIMLPTVLLARTTKARTITSIDENDKPFSPESAPAGFTA